MHRLLAMLLCMGFWGCGGAVETDPAGRGGADDGGDNASASGGASTSGAGASGGKVVGSSSDLVGTKRTLGNCKLGPRIADTTDKKNCLWIADDRCYKSHDAACDCACPLNAAQVTCAYGFPAVTGETEVYCY